VFALLFIIIIIVIVIIDIMVLHSKENYRSSNRYKQSRIKSSLSNCL